MDFEPHMAGGEWQNEVWSETRAKGRRTDAGCGSDADNVEWRNGVDGRRGCPFAPRISCD
jgi:hypothetical protein